MASSGEVADCRIHLPSPLPKSNAGLQMMEIFEMSFLEPVFFMSLLGYTGLTWWPHGGGPALKAQET